MGAIFCAISIASGVLYWNVNVEIGELYDYQAKQLMQENTQAINTAEVIKERKELIVETSLMAIAPLLLIFPLFTILIWFITRQGLLPLKEFKNTIASLDEHSLEPLVFSSLPLELKPLAIALNAMIERLKTAAQARKNFISDAAHELRTPLAALLLQLELAKKTVDPQETQMAFVALEKGVHRANRLMEQLLMLARQEKESDLIHEKVDLTYLVSEALVDLFPLAEAKKIELSVERIEQANVIAHAYDIQTLIINLLDNAIRYTPEGGMVCLMLYTLQHSVVLKIIDNGVGIKEGDKERIFDRFYRVNNHNSIGSGLGLSIVKEICQKYDIKIIVEDNMPIGTVVTLEFHKERLV